MTGFFSKERIVVGSEFNRWQIPVAAIAIHLCIGSAYAWSIFNLPLMRIQGVVTSAADDWTLKQVVWVFTVSMVVLGLCAAVAGKWLEQVGPRTVGILAAFCWGSGLLLSGLGIRFHQLWLLYFGYGVVGGCGLGLGYVSPVSTLIKWFPDRRGMAVGMAIMGFGGGAIIAAPLNESLIRYFYRAPQFLGPSDHVSLLTEGGKRFAVVEDQKREVVVIGANDVSQMFVRGPEGVYAARTGRMGVSETFFVLAAIHFLVMLTAALSFRLPASGWQPAGWVPLHGDQSAQKMISTRQVDMDQALKTPQFYLLWLLLCLNVTAGIGLLGVAKTMMTEIFGSRLPDIVTNSFSATFVVAISMFNMAGRFFWASASDFLGRKRTFAFFFLLGSVLYFSIPSITGDSERSMAVFSLVYFYAAVLLIISMYGGGFATIPAYLADLFGSGYVGAIHGRLLTAWSTAGVLGPLALTSLREQSLKGSLEQLAHASGASAFAEKFGAPIADLETLIAQKTVTLSKLMEIAPPGTVNPSSTIYNSTMYLMAALLIVAFVLNTLVQPVDPKHHLLDETPEMSG